ncbi:transcription repressor OFP1-like isoform X2 [Andrographis paniculata]|nr:transcription repressor OFP1-like isoform X2 [Andrographis paniculata]
MKKNNSNNYRWFRVSDMIPNASSCFFSNSKSRNTNTITNTNKTPKTTKKINSKLQSSSSSSSSSSCRYQVQLQQQYYQTNSPSLSESESSTSKKLIHDVLVSVSLPPILTKPATPHQTNSHSQINQQPPILNTANHNNNVIMSSSKNKKKKKMVSSSAAAGGVRIRRRSFRGSYSFVDGDGREDMIMKVRERVAIVKESFDPERDLRESIMEMIMIHMEMEMKKKTKKNMMIHESSSPLLDEILSSYLSLNSPHYHHLIIKVFHHICLTLPLTSSSRNITRN